MLAEKYAVDKKKKGRISYLIKRMVSNVKTIDPENFVGHLADLLFKGVLIFAIPYFIFILIKFLSL